MRIGKTLRDADPLGGETPTMSLQGRATLRSITGSVAEPTEVTAPARRRGLVPALATGGLALALGIGLAVWPTTGTASLAYADTVEAKVVSAKTTPGDWGATTTIALPLPEIDGKQGYRVVRFWQKNGGSVPAAETVTFKKQSSSGDSAVYKSTDFPFGDLVFSFFGPNSPECENVDVDGEIGLTAVGASEDGDFSSSIYICGSGFVDSVMWTGSNAESGAVFSIERTGTDLAELEDWMSQFEVGADGQWASTPAGAQVTPPAEVSSGESTISAGSGEAESAGPETVEYTVGGDAPETQVVEAAP